MPPSPHGTLEADEPWERTPLLKDGPSRRPSASSSTFSSTSEYITQLDPKPCAPDGSEGEEQAHGPLPPASEARLLLGSDVSAARFWAIIAIIHMANFVAAFDGTIMSSSHPVVTSYFHASESASWVSTGFMLANMAVTPLVGALAEPLGRRTVFVTMGVVLLVGTLWCAAAQSMLEFILARSLTGCGVAGMSLMGGILTSDLVSVEKRGLYQALGSLVYHTGGALGAAMGGWMAEALGWRWEFGVQMPYLLLLPIGGYLCIPAGIGQAHGHASKTLAQAMEGFDYAGCLTISVSVTTLVVFATVGGTILPWTHPLIVACGAVSVLTAVLFVHVERTVAKPVFPLRLIAPSPYRNVLVSTICCQIVLHGLYFNLPIYFQAVLLDAPTASGLRLVMAAAAGLVSGSACGLTIARYGRTNPCMQFGVPLMVAAAAVACFFQRDWADYTYSLTLAAVLFGGGWYFPGSYVTVLAASEQRDQPAANTVVITTRSIGLVLGISTSSLVMQNSLKAYLAELVAGPDRERVIELVREAVEAVGRLEEPYLGQVIASYEAACRTTFATLVGFGVVGMVAVWGIREVPRIRKRA